MMFPAGHVAVFFVSLWGLSHRGEAATGTAGHTDIRSMYKCAFPASRRKKSEKSEETVALSRFSSYKEM